MVKSIKIRDIVLGEGVPKVCVPLVEKTKENILNEAKNLKNIKLDIIEWRIDFYEEVQNSNQVIELLIELRKLLDNIPLLVTFRSKKEGGELEISTEYYINLNKEIIKSGYTDLIDIELFTGDEFVKELVECAYKNNVKVVMSNHDFNKTPTKEEIIKRLCKMQELKADIPKIAVMPKSPDDVLILLEATNEMVKNYADRPIITMSMEGIGLISRLSGEIFGSALTFGAAKIASAPGQIEVDKLYNVLNIIHESK